MSGIFARLHEAVTQPAPDGLHLTVSIEDAALLHDLCRAECPDCQRETS